MLNRKIFVKLVLLAFAVSAAKLITPPRPPKEKGIRLEDVSDHNKLPQHGKVFLVNWESDYKEPILFKVSKSEDKEMNGQKALLLELDNGSDGIFLGFNFGNQNSDGKMSAADYSLLIHKELTANLLILEQFVALKCIDQSPKLKALVVSPTEIIDQPEYITTAPRFVGNGCLIYAKLIKETQYKFYFRFGIHETKLAIKIYKDSQGSGALGRSFAHFTPSDQENNLEEFRSHFHLLNTSGPAVILYLDITFSKFSTITPLALKSFPYFLNNASDDLLITLSIGKSPMKFCLCSESEIGVFKENVSNDQQLKFWIQKKFQSLIIEEIPLLHQLHEYKNLYSLVYHFDQIAPGSDSRMQEYITFTPEQGDDFLIFNKETMKYNFTVKDDTLTLFKAYADKKTVKKAQFKITKSIDVKTFGEIFSNSNMAVSNTAGSIIFHAETEEELGKTISFLDIDIKKYGKVDLGSLLWLYYFLEVDNGVLYFNIHGSLITGLEAIQKRKILISKYFYEPFRSKVLDKGIDFSINYYINSHFQSFFFSNDLYLSEFENLWRIRVPEHLQEDELEKLDEFIQINTVSSDHYFCVCFDKKDYVFTFSFDFEKIIVTKIAYGRNYKPRKSRLVMEFPFSRSDTLEKFKTSFREVLEKAKSQALPG